MITSITELIDLGLCTWLLFFCLCLMVAVIILSKLLLKKSRSLELLQFELKSTGFSIRYGINRDKELELLALENIALTNELEAIKKSIKLSFGQRLQIGTLLIVTALVYHIHQSKNKWQVSSRSDDSTR